MGLTCQVTEEFSGTVTHLIKKDFAWISSVSIVKIAQKMTLQMMKMSPGSESRKFGCVVLFVYIPFRKYCQLRIHFSNSDPRIMERFPPYSLLYQLDHPNNIVKTKALIDAEFMKLLRKKFWIENEIF